MQAQDLSLATDKITKVLQEVGVAEGSKEYPCLKYLMALNF